jgi:hypothetical protein
MRALALLLALVAFATADTRAAATTGQSDVRIVRVFTGWRDAASFKRISEYFTGRENTGGEVLIRSQPQERSGYYFLVRTANSGAPFTGRFAFTVVLPGKPDAHTFAFTADVPTGQTVFNFGLTGADWPGSTTTSSAWKLELRDATGTAVAIEKSYLWERPGN